MKFSPAVMLYYVILLHITTLDSASHETRSFLGSVRHERA